MRSTVTFATLSVARAQPFPQQSLYNLLGGRGSKRLYCGLGRFLGGYELVHCRGFVATPAVGTVFLMWPVEKNKNFELFKTAPSSPN